MKKLDFLLVTILITLFYFIFEYDIEYFFSKKLSEKEIAYLEKEADNNISATLKLSIFYCKGNNKKLCKEWKLNYWRLKCFKGVFLEKDALVCKKYNFFYFSRYDGLRRNAY